MQIPDTFRNRLADTSLAEPLSLLDRIYARIDAQQADWMAASPFRCPDGCGSCCDGFEPEILDIEALYLAAWWIAHAPDDRFGVAPAAGDAPLEPGCVLADPKGAYHCTAYGGRPLVCRLFAYSGDRDKQGEVRFRLCSKIPDAGRREFGAADLSALFGRLPPVMGDLAHEADALMPGRSDERRPLRDALPAALSKIRHLFELTESSAFADGRIIPFVDRGEADGDNDNPGGSTPPMPRAG